MPELPEVERERRRLERLAKGKRIARVETKEDTIVFSGTTHAAFATALEGKTVKEVKRLGKNFYLLLDGGNTVPVFHFGMSGMAYIRGEATSAYRVKGKKKQPGEGKDEEEWPPKYVKACISFEDPATAETVGEWAFCDARRLGRIKVFEVEEGKSVEDVPPLSELGADPLLDMPSVEVLRAALSARKAPIKAVLLDQNGPLCGIGNYMVDEILFQSAIHPSHPASDLSALPASPTALTTRALQNPSEDALKTLHANVLYVTTTAVDADADAERFPASWLFKLRWSKGKKKDKSEIELPDGSTAQITFVTVGGRTSAVVEALQVLPEEFAKKIREKEGAKGKGKSPAKGRGKAKGKGKKKASDSDEEEDEREAEAKELDEEEEKEKKPTTSPHFKRTRVSQSRSYKEPDSGEESALTELSESEEEKPAKKRAKRAKAKKEDD
ncbi:hypothetical protein JCM10213_006421 [Rhodosporidiobolus nylandii]